ncbi:MAG TPA: hypothetical protein VIH10_08400 [Kribbella sp.]
MGESELGTSLTAPATVDTPSRLAILQTTVTDVPQHVRVEILPTSGGSVAQGTLRSGTANDPHVLRISPRLGDAQLRQVWTHQLSLMTQELAAAQAEQPTGILGRLKSAFGHERRDRRLRADHAAFQLLTRDWQQARLETLTNGQPAGPRSVAEIERDLEGLARTIRRHGGAEPALPWTAEAIAVPDASTFGVAAARAEAESKPPRFTPGHLRAQVVTQIETLQTAVTDLEDKARTKRDSAEAATEQARKHEEDAGKEAAGQDRGAGERARKLRVAAGSARNKSRRHTEIAGAYRQAATDAEAALAGYRTLLSELDANAPQARIAELAGAARQQIEVYRDSLDQALPVKDLLATGVPAGQRLTLPIADINRVLAANGLEPRMSTDGPEPMPSAEYRRLLSQDGMVFAVPGSPDDKLGELVQVRLRLKPRDVTEMTDLDYDLAEQMSGTLGEGGQSVSSTNTHSTSLNVGVNLQPFLAMAAPGTPLHAASQLVSPRVDVSRGRTLAETGGATAHHQSGWVDDNRGESLFCAWSGELEIQVRRSPTEPWSPVETVDVGRQQTWVSSAYTVKPPSETVTLAELGFAADVSADFPRHAVTQLTGLHGVTERLVADAQQRHGDLDRVAYDHIAGLIVDDSHRLLREASQPGGITRRIPTGGETEYELTWEVEPVWAEAELVGESSSEMWQEEVLVDFAGSNAGQTFGTSLTGTASVSYPGKAVAGAAVAGTTALNDVAGTTVDLSPSVSVGRNVSRQGGQNVSMTSITPAVHRNQGPTQGVLVGLKVKATLRRLDDPKVEPVVVRDVDNCKGLLRVPENDLLRAGGRASKDAVLRNPDETIRTDRLGRALLRGDAEPSTEAPRLPPWMGRGENQLRGVGNGLPQNLKGAERTRDDALRALSKMGLVPPLDDKLKPRRGAPATPMQLANYERIKQQISAPRIEAGIDQACQGGLIVLLEDHGFAGTPRWRPFRLSLTQDYKLTAAGTSSNENIVRLGISSWATGRTIGRSKSLPVSAGVGASDGPAQGVRGWAARLGVKFSRNALGKSFSWTAGRRVNRVTLSESTAPLDRIEQGVRITFTEITDRGDSEPLADVDGTFEVAYDSAHTRADAPVYEPNPKPPHVLAVQQSIPVAVDAGNPADRLCTAIGSIRADGTALQALHKALSPNSLMANREWMNGSYKLPFVVVRGPGSPVEAFADGTLLPQEYEIVIRGTAVSQTHAGMSEQNTVDINFAMSDVGYTTGTSGSGGIAVDGGLGPVRSDGTGRSGGVSVGRTGGTSQSTTTSETSGDEQLLVNPGTHHDFIERYRLVADVVHNGQVVQSVPLQDALVQKSMAERRALELYASRKLDLPLWAVADVAERYLNDKLTMSPRVAAGFVRRYRQEKDGVTSGLPATHSADRLADKLRAQSRVPASHASNEDERLTRIAARAEAMAARTRVMHLSDAYDASLGAAQIESITVEGQPDERVDLRKLVNPQIDELAPGLRAASPLLQNALDVDLSPDSYQGHLEDMFGPDGFEGPIEVPIEGQDRPDVLFVRVWARYEGDPVIEGVPEKDDGTPDIPKEDAGGIKQKYDYETEDRSVGHGTTYSAGVDGKTPGAAGANLSGSVGTDRSRQHTAGSGEQNTTLDRLGHFDLARIQRTVVFTTQVVRVRNAGASAMASARWKLGRVDPADITSVSEPREVRAVMTAMVPRAELEDGPGSAPEQSPEERPEHRPVRLPEGAIPVRAVPYGRGEPKKDQLYSNLVAYLRRPDVLGPRGVAEYRHLIRPMLKPSAVMAKAGRLLAEGIELPPMARAGNGRTTVNVTVKAVPVGWELAGDPLEGQAGRVWRRQKTYRSSTTGNRLTPLTGGGGVDGGLVSVGGSIGEQLKEQSSDANGTRLETSRFEEGQLVTVRIPVVYEATVELARDNGRGRPVTKETTHLPNLASGQIYVRMLRHQYLEGLRQMEAGAAFDSVLADARLQAVPEKLGRPDITATEYAQGENGAVYQPYRPLLDAVDKAKAEKRPIVLLMREADGTERLYQAFPNGTMAGVKDGGFASAFATLHPQVALMCQGRVDLRELYNTSSPDGTFSAKVAAELEKKGVPRDMLKGLDYQTTARHLATPGAQSAQYTASSGAGRTIAPTGHGPSLSGP